MVAAHVHPDLITGYLVGQEAVWWLNPHYRKGFMGLRLLATAEAWAREQGARYFDVLEPADTDGLAAIYERRGYLRVETTWRKDLAA
jgi:hypothetical protein